MSQALTKILKTLQSNIKAEFYPYAGVKHSVRKKNGLIYIRISDTFSDAPREVLLSIGRILLAKLNRKQVDKKDRRIYSQYVESEQLQRKVSKIIPKRRRRIKIIKGIYKNLDESFKRVNEIYFRNSMEKPQLTWSLQRAKRTLGRYDSERDVVSISRILDSPQIPEELLDFIMYHELLHKKHGITVKGNRRRIHTPQFKEDEKKFHNYQKIKKLMENLAKT